MKIGWELKVFDVNVVQHMMEGVRRMLLKNPMITVHSLQSGYSILSVFYHGINPQIPISWKETQEYF